MKQILIYPYTREDYALTKHLFMTLPNIKVASVEGSALIGHDISYAHNKPPIGLQVVKLKKINLSEIDEVYLLNVENDFLITEIKNDIKNFVSHDIKVTTYQDFLLNQNRCNIITNEYIKSSYDSFYEIKTPTIGVCGLLHSLDTNELCLDIIRKLEDKGYKSTTISQDSKLRIANINVFDFFQKEKNIENIIVDFNQFVKSLLISNKPDVIIISIPDGIGMVNNQIMNNFGIYLDIVMKVVSFDYFVLNMPFNYFDLNYLDDLNHTFIKKYDCSIDAFHINNELNNQKAGLSINKLKKVYCGYENLANELMITSEKYILTNFFSRNTIDVLVNNMICKFTTV